MLAETGFSRSPAPRVQDALGAPRHRFVGSALLGALQRVAAWQDRWRQRRLLESLDERSMSDLGLSRADIYREASKPFWTR